MSVKTGYAFDLKTKEYMGEELVQEDPLNPGHFLLPENVTLIAPPVFGSRQYPLWDVSEWRLVPDYRGCLFWDTLTAEIVNVYLQLNETPLSEWTEEDPTGIEFPVFNNGIWETDEIRKFSNGKEQLCSRCDFVREEKMKSGFSFGGHMIQADPAALQNANGFLTIITAGANPFPITWRTRENVNIQFLTSEEYSTFTSQMLTFVQEKYHEEWGVKDSIRASATIEEAENIFIQYEISP